VCFAGIDFVTMASGGGWPSLDYLNEEAQVCDLLLLQHIVIKHEPFNFLSTLYFRPVVSSFFLLFFVT